MDDVIFLHADTHIDIDLCHVVFFLEGKLCVTTAEKYCEDVLGLV